MKLFELKSTTQWTWSGLTSAPTAAFDVEGTSYAVEFFPGVDEGEFYIEFFRGEGEQRLTGTGKSVTIFAAVIQIVKEFIQKFNPQELVFAADQSERFPLYEKLLKILERAGWETNTTSPGRGSRKYIAKKPQPKKKQDQYDDFDDLLDYEEYFTEFMDWQAT